MTATHSEKVALLRALEQGGGWLKPPEAGAYLRVNARTLLRAATDGRLRAIRIGSKRGWRFRKDWLDDFAAACVVTTHELSR